VRDRGQEFVDLAPAAASGKFYYFDDIEVAMGWKSLGEILAKREPDDLSDILRRMKIHWADLEQAFSGDRQEFTRAKVERAVQQRSEGFRKGLPGNTQR
jgi:hypothetical protein